MADHADQTFYRSPPAAIAAPPEQSPTGLAGPAEQRLGLVEI